METLVVVIALLLISVMVGRMVYRLHAGLGLVSFLLVFVVGLVYYTSQVSGGPLAGS